jgi:hypothetical protein
MTVYTYYLSLVMHDLCVQRRWSQYLKLVGLVMLDEKINSIFILLNYFTASTCKMQNATLHKSLLGLHPNIYIIATENYVSY